MISKNSTFTTSSLVGPSTIIFLLLVETYHPIWSSRSQFPTPSLSQGASISPSPISSFLPPKSLRKCIWGRKTRSSKKWSSSNKTKIPIINRCVFNYPWFPTKWWSREQHTSIKISNRRKLILNVCISSLLSLMSSSCNITRLYISFNKSVALCLNRSSCMTRKSNKRLFTCF